MKLIKRRDRRSQLTTSTPCRLLALPAEIRLLIYSHMAPNGFLPNAPYKTYIGLMLSCPQIYNEMTSEAVRLAPSILRTIQFSVNATPMKLQPLRPTSFASLMHLTIGIPRWAMLDRPTIMGILQAMAPVLELHLARLTIGLEDLEGEDDVLHIVETLNPAQIARYMSQVQDMPAPLYPPSDSVASDHYRIRTTYSNVIGLVTAMNCLIAPGMCNGKHAPANHWCLRASGLNPPFPTTTCNVRKIAFRLKRLHDEKVCGCGRLPAHFPHLVYPFRGPSYRWELMLENPSLEKERWMVHWRDDKGKLPWSLKGKPGLCVWVKLKEKRESRLERAVKSLFRQT